MSKTALLMNCLWYGSISLWIFAVAAATVFSAYTLSFIMILVGLLFRDAVSYMREWGMG